MYKNHLALKILKFIYFLVYINNTYIAILTSKISKITAVCLSRDLQLNSFSLEDETNM